MTNVAKPSGNSSLAGQPYMASLLVASAKRCVLAKASDLHPWADPREVKSVLMPTRSQK